MCDSVSQLIYKVGTVTNSHIGTFISNRGLRATVSQSWDYDLQGWDRNQFPHWYFIPNIGLRATLFHNLEIMIYKLGTVTNSHIGILFPILDYVRLWFTILGL